MHTVSACTFCGKDYQHGTEGMRVEDWTNIDRSCLICHVDVCNACAVTWGHQRENVKKICHNCAARAGLRSGGKMTGMWLERIKGMIRNGVKEVRCPDCGTETDVNRAMETWIHCHKCSQEVCPDCGGSRLDTGTVMFCRSCEEKEAQWKINNRIERLKPENNCQFCDGFDQRNRGGVYNPTPPLAQVFPCTLCGRRICDNCKENRRTNYMNIFCCRDCMQDPRTVIVRRNPFEAYFEGNQPGRSGINLLSSLDRWAERIRDIFGG